MNCKTVLVSMTLQLIAINIQSTLSCIPNQPTPHYPLPQFNYKKTPDPWFESSSFSRIHSRVTGCLCGKSEKKPISPRIRRYSGFTSPAGSLEFPWQALIRVQFDQNNAIQHGAGATINNSPHNHYFCGGTVINDLFILTNGQCVLQYDPGDGLIFNFPEESMKILPSQIKIWVGITERGSLVEVDSLDVQKIIYHPAFPKQSEADVALLKLKFRINFNDSQTRPVCLPFSTDIEKNNLFKPNSNQVVGWFSSRKAPRQNENSLRKVAVSTANCPKLDPESADSFNYHDYLCTPHFLEQHPKLLHDMDLGSPLIMESVDNRKFQLGILSWISKLSVKDEIGHTEETRSIRLFTRLTSPDILSFIDYFSDSEGAHWCTSHVIKVPTTTLPTTATRRPVNPRHEESTTPLTNATNLSTPTTTSTKPVTTTPTISTIATTTKIATKPTTPKISTTHTTSVTVATKPTTMATKSTTPTMATKSTTPTMATKSTTTTMATKSTTPTMATKSTTPTMAKKSTTPTMATKPTTSTMATKATTPTFATKPTTSTMATKLTTPTFATKPTTSTMATKPTTTTTTTKLTTTTPITTIKSTTPTIATKPTTPNLERKPTTPTTVATPTEPTTISTTPGWPTSTRKIPRSWDHDDEDHSSTSSENRTINNLCHCGLRDRNRKGRIFFGANDALPYEFPWQVLVIVHPMGEEQNKSYCSGTIINSLFILTSGNCVTKVSNDDSVSSYSIREVDIKASVYTNEDDHSAKMLAIDTIIVHPLYLKSRNDSFENLLDYDIALIRLKDHIPFSGKAEDISPVCFPETHDVLKSDEERISTLAGWKITKMEQYPLILQSIAVELYKDTFCELNTWGSPERFLCGKGPYQDIHSLSGGFVALRMQSPDVLLQIGVVSHKKTFWINRRASPLGYYSNVMKYLPFIDFLSQDSEAIWCRRDSKVSQEYIRNVRKVEERFNLFKGSQAEKRKPWIWESAHLKEYVANRICEEDDSKLKFCNCGRRGTTSSIIKGRQATHFEFPWHTLLSITSDAFSGTHSCSASIINNMVLITSANCVVNRYGDILDASEMVAEFLVVDDFWKGPKFSIDKIMIHPGFMEYNSSTEITHKYDLALLKLKAPIVFKKKHYRPVCLPELGEKISFGGETIGMSLRWNRLKTIENKITHRLLKKEIILHDPHYCDIHFNSSSRTICTDYSSSKTEALEEDLGKGLLLSSAKGSHMMLIGITSFRISDSIHGHDFDLEYYTKIDGVVAFINYYSNEWGASWCQNKLSLV